MPISRQAVPALRRTHGGYQKFFIDAIWAYYIGLNTQYRTSEFGRCRKFGLVPF